MSSTTFVSGTVIPVAWLNDVNTMVYGITWSPTFNDLTTTSIATTSLTANTIVGTTSVVSPLLTYGSGPLTVGSNTQNTIIEGYLQLGTGAVRRQFNSKLNDIVSVKDFGAAGDGMTDDTTALNAAHTASGVGGKVYYPQGSYLVSGVVNVLSGQTIEGASSGYAATPGSWIVSTGAINYFKVDPDAKRVTIRNMGFSGTNPFTVGSVGIFMGGSTGDGNTNNVTIEQCYFYRIETNIKGFHISGATQFQVSNVAVRDCKFDECGYGIYLDSQNTDGWTIENYNGSFKYALLYCVKAGYTHLHDCNGFGYAANAALVLLTDASRETIVLEQCQCESTDFMVHQTVGSGAFNPIVLTSCKIDSPITLDLSGYLIIEKSNIAAAVTLSDSGYLWDRNNRWQDSTASASLSLASNSIVEHESGSQWESVSESQFNHRVERCSIGKMISPTYGVNVVIDPWLGSTHRITVTNNTAFQINNPTYRGTAFPGTGMFTRGGQEITIMVKNTVGAPMGVITWDTKYKMSAWTNPATGFSRSITFMFDGTNWYQISQTGVDIPN